MPFFSLNPGACKTWLVTGDRSPEAMLIDPVVDHVDLYRQVLAARKLRLVRIIDTHTHADHVSAGTLLARETGALYAMHHASPVKTIGERLKEGDTVVFGDDCLRVMHTPGHTRDSLSLVNDRLLLTGDFLFLGEGGAGRTDLLGGDPGEHWDSLQKIAGLPDHLAILPGHDYRGGSAGVLKEERQRNPRLAPRTREDYVRWLGAMSLEPAEWMIAVINANARGATDRKGLPIPEGGACCEVGGGAPPAVDLPSIRPEELAPRLRESPRVFAVLDVREPHEYSGPSGHVPGARNLPSTALASRLAEISDLKDRTIYVICASGGRSARALPVLLANGFRDAINVIGGMKAWTLAGLPREIGPSQAVPA